MTHFLDYAIIILSATIFITAVVYIYKAFKGNKKN